MLRDNGAIIGGAGGFAIDDEVIVLKALDGSKIYVVGHVDGVRKCGVFAVFEFKFESYYGGYNVIKTIVVVWDLNADKVLFTARESTDIDYVNWKKSKKEYLEADLQPLSLTSCGRVGSLANGSYPSLGQLLTPGATDSYYYYQDIVLGDHETVTVHDDTKEASFDNTAIAEWLSLQGMQIVPESPDTVWGFRLRYKDDLSYDARKTSDDPLPAGAGQWNVAQTVLYDFYGPFGLALTHTGEYLSNGTGGAYYALYGPWSYTSNYINTYSTGYPPWVYYQNIRRDYDGLFTAMYAVNFYLIQFCYTSEVGVYNPDTGRVDVTRTVHARQTAIQAQALRFIDIGKERDWFVKGRNSALEAELLTMVTLGYTNMGLANNVIAPGRTKVTLYR